MSNTAEALVKAYFSAQAPTYQQGWGKWPWSKIRQSESTAIMQLLATDEVSGKDIIEFGSGSGFYTRMLLRLKPKNICAIDFSREMLDHLPNSAVAAGLITPIHGDAMTVDVGKQFELIFSAGMLEFVPNAAATLANIAKHAAADATLVLLIPRNNWLGYLYKLFHLKHGVKINLFSLQKIKVLTRYEWKLVESKKCGLFSLALKFRTKTNLFTPRH